MMLALLSKMAMVDSLPSLARALNTAVSEPPGPVAGVVEPA